MPPQHYHAGPPLHHAMQQPIPVYPPPPHQHHPWEQPVAQVGGYSQPYGRGRGRGRGNSVVAALIATYAGKQGVGTGAVSTTISRVQHRKLTACAQTTCTP
eukprot:1157683-Pelagomonas_calceolata.AAC.10